MNTENAKTTDTTAGGSAAETHSKDADSRLKNVGRELVEGLEVKSREMAENALKSAADKIRVYNSAIQASADTLANNDEPGVADSVRAVSDLIEDAADSVANCSATEAIDYARDATKRYPAIAMVGAAVAGFAIGRLLSVGADDQRAEANAR